MVLKEYRRWRKERRKDERRYRLGEAAWVVLIDGHE
jgi:hypothetical protein